jgi:hypothetical protein
MQVQVERGCGLDVHQATFVACLLISLKNGKKKKQIQTFNTTTRELLKMREWLLSEGCTHVAMESTGVQVSYNDLGDLYLDKLDKSLTRYLAHRLERWATPSPSHFTKTPHDH